MDSGLVQRAEQAMLGAMIARPGRVPDLPGAVTPDLFSDPRHQAIVASLTGRADGERGSFGWFRNLFARFSIRARETATYMETLPAMCPDPAHMGSYFEMLADARAQRGAALQAAAAQARLGSQILTGAAEQLHAMGARAGSGAGELPADVTRLARALSGKAQRLVQEYSPGPAQEGAGFASALRSAAPANGQARSQGQPVRPADDSAPRRPRASASVPQPGQAENEGRVVKPVRGTRLEDVENLVLASMIHNPDEASTVIEWLPADAFSAEPRRELFKLISEFATEHRDYDELILAWAVSERMAGTAPGKTLARDEGRLQPATVAEIGRLHPASGTASVLGRLLLAEHVCAVTYGPGWVQADRAVRPDTARPLPGRETETVPKPANASQARVKEQQEAVRGDAPVPSAAMWSRSSAADPAVQMPPPSAPGQSESGIAHVR